MVLPGFDYAHKPAERFEIPIGERVAAIRARKADDRSRAKANAQRKAQRQVEEQERAARKAAQPARSPLSRTHRRGR